MQFIRPLTIGTLLAAGMAGFLAISAAPSFASERNRNGIERSHSERGERHDRSRRHDRRSERHHWEGRRGSAARRTNAIASSTR